MDLAQALIQRIDIEEESRDFDFMEGAKF